MLITDQVREIHPYEQIPYTEEVLGEDLMDLVYGNEQQIIDILPSIHRVQKIFGRMEDFSTDSFVENVIFDVLNVSDSQRSIEETLKTIELLQEVTFRCLSLFVYGQDLSRFQTTINEEDFISTRYSIVFRTIWRTWEPENPDTTMLVESLLDYIDVNLHFTRLTVFRDDRRRGYTVHFGNDTNDPEMDIIEYEANTILFNLSAESQVIRREHLLELQSLCITDPLVYPFLQGVLVEELAEKYDLDIQDLIEYLRSSLCEVVQIGRRIYHWSDGFTTFVKQFGNQKSLKHRSIRSIPSQTERVALFRRKNANLENIFACAERMYLLRRKCLLRYLGYTDNPSLSLREWLETENIGEELFRTEVRLALEQMEEMLSSQPIPSRETRVILSEAYEYKVTNSSFGVAQREGSTRLKLLLLAQKELPEGSITNRERETIQYIYNYFLTENRVPTFPEMASALGYTQKVIERMVANLAQWDGVIPRYSTSEDVIREDTNKYQVIRWYQINSSNKELMNERLSRLTEEEKAIFLEHIIIEDAVYLTTEEILSRLQSRGYCKGLTNEKMLRLLGQILTILQEDRQNTPIDRISERQIRQYTHRYNAICLYESHQSLIDSLREILDEDYEIFLAYVLPIDGEYLTGEEILELLNSKGMCVGMTARNLLYRLKSITKRLIKETI